MKRSWLISVIYLFIQAQFTIFDAYASVIQLPATGQTTTYAGGDDGALKKGVAWPNPRFADNNNGTVNDNLTGLVWLKNASCTDTVGGIAGGEMNWASALTFSNSMATGKCGLTDGSSAGQWRLPNVVELSSLIDLQNYNPTLASGHPFTNVGLGNIYWSSSTYASSTNFAWIVNMDFGYVNQSYKAFTSGVWPVRSGQALGDSVLPIITTFAIPATGTNLTIPVTSLNATDKAGVTGWCLTETNESGGCSFNATKPESYVFSSGGVKTLYVWARDAAGNISASAAASITVSPPSQTLNVTVTGLGTVTSDPQNNSAIACTGAGKGCSTTFPYNTPVLLIATPDPISRFSTWGDACAGASKNCNLTLDATKNVTATFIAAPKAMIGSTGYDSLAAAYAGASTISTILTLDSDTTDTGLVLSLNKTITIKGGYKADYSGKSGLPTLLNGPLNVRKGKLTVDNLVVK